MTPPPRSPVDALEVHHADGSHSHAAGAHEQHPADAPHSHRVPTTDHLIKDRAQLNQYQIISLIGAGYHGKVYYAKKVRSQPPVGVRRVVSASTIWRVARLLMSSVHSPYHALLHYTSPRLDRST